MTLRPPAPAPAVSHGGRADAAVPGERIAQHIFGNDKVIDTDPSPP